jgi:nitroreductase
MNDLLHWLSNNLIVTIIFLGLLSIIITYIIAFIQGRSVSFWPPRIEGKPIQIPPHEKSPISVIDAIKIRKSVRGYLDKPVEEEKLTAIMEAARLAPSASNRQEWRFVLVREKEIRKKFTEVSRGPAFIGHAPVIIAACADTDGHVMSCGQPSYPIDVAIALEHIALAAVELGLGACWIGAFNEQKVKQLLGIPEKIRVVELMTLGYPANPSPVEKKRLPLDQIVKYEHW